MFSRFTSINFPILFLSFCIAVGTWYAITIHGLMDMDMEVQLDYNNIPHGLVITGGLVDSIVVTVRGPKALLESRGSQRAYVMDLSMLRKGKNIVPFSSPKWEHRFRAFEFLEISPNQMTVYADNLMERNVPIKTTLDTALHSSAFKVTNLTTAPNTALIRGPEKIIAQMDSVILDVHVDAGEKPGDYSKTLPLVSGKQQVSITPSNVAVRYTVVSKRTKVSIEEEVLINGAEDAYIVSPSRIRLEVEVPEALARNTSYLDGVEVRLTPPLLEPGQSAQGSVNIHLPEGMSIEKESHSKFTVTRIQ